MFQLYENGVVKLAFDAVDAASMGCTFADVIRGVVYEPREFVRRLPPGAVRTGPGALGLLGDVEGGVSTARGVSLETSVEAGVCRDNPEEGEVGYAGDRLESGGLGEGCADVEQPSQFAERCRGRQEGSFVFGERLGCGASVDGSRADESRLDGVVSGGEREAHSPGDAVGRGVNYARNVASREKKKRRKERKRGDGGAVAGRLGSWRHDENVGNVAAKEPSALRDSLDAKRIAENKLAEATALRRLAVLEAVEVDDEVKRQRTRIAAMTEHNMVSMERDHAKLKATGNVPGLPGGGFAETVLTDGDTISPNSSASMADYRKCQKDLLDSVAEVEKLRAALERCGISADHIDKYDKSVWTDNIETFDALDAMYDDYVLEPEEYGDKLRLVDVGAYGSPMPKTARAGAVKSEPKSVRAGEVVGASETGVGGVSGGDAAHFRKTDGTLYTQLEALRWLGSYAYAGNKLDCGRSDADVARECNTTVGVLQKYRALKARFGLMQ